MADLFYRFVATVEACGRVEVESVRKGLVLHGSRRIFASVHPVMKGIGGHLNLPFQVDDARFTRIEPLTKRLYFHRFALSEMTELDDAFVGWIRTAYAIGQGMYERVEEG